MTGKKTKASAKSRFPAGITNKKSKGKNKAKNKGANSGGLRGAA
jgi:hypothetical protein